MIVLIEHLLSHGLAPFLHFFQRRFNRRNVAQQLLLLLPQAIDMGLQRPVYVGLAGKHACDVLWPQLPQNKDALQSRQMPPHRKSISRFGQQNLASADQHLHCGNGKASGSCCRTLTRCRESTNTPGSPCPIIPDANIRRQTILSVDITSMSSGLAER